MSIQFENCWALNFLLSVVNAPACYPFIQAFVKRYFYLLFHIACESMHIVDQILYTLVQGHSKSSKSPFPNILVGDKTAKERSLYSEIEMLLNKSQSTRTAQQMSKLLNVATTW